MPSQEASRRFNRSNCTSLHRSKIQLATHSITSSVVESSVAGTVRSSILAVSALMTNSKFGEGRADHQPDHAKGARHYVPAHTARGRNCDNAFQTHFFLNCKAACSNAGLHNSCWLRTNASASAGLAECTKAPRTASLSLISGITSTERRSSLILRTIASGVPTGATTHCQPAATKPGRVSTTVGKSGQVGETFLRSDCQGLELT